jgi:O-antigen/teichoic acid export membrane protein
MAEARLIQHLRNYASAGALSALVGVVSFPLLTRNLSVADYGIVGLVTASASFFIAIGKLGVQHAVIRYFNQIKHGNADFSLQQMNSTVVVIFSALATIATVIWILSGNQVLPHFLQSETIASLFLVGAGIVFVRILGSGVMNFLRAQQRSAEVAIAQSTARIVNISLLVVLVLLFDLKPWAVIVCLFVAETAGMSYAAFQYRNDFYFEFKEVSNKLTKAMLIYGMPLMLLESLGFVLRLSDRYMIEAILGVNALGQYSASYNLCSYLEIIVLAAILQAIRPAYMQLWESEGHQRTSNFLSDSFHIYMVVGIPFVVMFAVTSPYLLSLLAGARYEPGTVVIPFVAASFWMDGAILFLSAGLYIFKNTKALMFCGLAATIFNVTLNIVLIPRFGISGAAAVTVLSYALFMFTIAFMAFRRVRFIIRLAAPLSISSLGILVYLTSVFIDLGSDIMNLLVKGFAGTLVLSLGIWFFVPQLRNWVLVQKNMLIRR